MQVMNRHELQLVITRLQNDLREKNESLRRVRSQLSEANAKISNLQNRLESATSRMQRHLESIHELTGNLKASMKKTSVQQKQRLYSIIRSAKLTPKIRYHGLELEAAGKIRSKFQKNKKRKSGKSLDNSSQSG